MIMWSWKDLFYLMRDTIKMNKQTLILNTVKYLKFTQIYYRLYYLLRNKFRKISGFKYDFVRSSDSVELSLVESCENYSTCMNKKFKMLNFSKKFENEIDWNYDKYGKLWTYNLTYFEYLKDREDIYLIYDFIDTVDGVKDGLEPFPISLRGINWIKFISKYNIKDKKIDDSLYTQYYILLDSLEYHLLGNHLLENAFSLLFGGYYFQDKLLYKKAKEILQKELEEQILDDGAHFELSPMYHSLMLYRILDAYNLVLNNEVFNGELLPILKRKAELMLSFLNVIAFENNDIPLVNDTAFGIAPNPVQLNSYANRIGLDFRKIKLSQSGYRKFVGENYEFFIDVGEVGPTYQAGHAHADTFSFLLYIRGCPVIIDTGTSTYEVDERRFYERSTRAHNTVSINHEDSSQVWAGHRVGKRANVVILEDTTNSVIAEHNGYEQEFGVIHKRSVKCMPNHIIIRDDIFGNKGEAYLHFDPNQEFEIKGTVIFGKGFQIRFDGASNIMKEEAYYSPEFNFKESIYKLEISFKDKLTTEIII